MLLLSENRGKFNRYGNTPGRRHRENLELDRTAPDSLGMGHRHAQNWLGHEVELEASSYRHRFMRCLFRLWLISRHCFSTAGNNLNGCPCARPALVIHFWFSMLFTDRPEVACNWKWNYCLKIVKAVKETDVRNIPVISTGYTVTHLDLCGDNML